MDPFTTLLRGYIGKKMVDAGTQAYNDTRASIDKFFANWDASLKANNKGGAKKNAAKANADAVSSLFERNGTLNTDPLASKKTASSTDAEVDSTLSQSDTAVETESETPAKTEDETDVVTYTYKPGDTFGQVLLNLGLSDGSHLWGSGGDVEYYTQQLIDQNMLDARGNVKLGIPFKLRRRK